MHNKKILINSVIILVICRKMIWWINLFAARYVVSVKNKWNGKKYHTFGTVLNIQSKIVERGKMDISNTHIQDGLLFLFGRGNRAKGGGVNYSN